MPRRSRFPGFLWVKRDRLIQEHRIDPYQARWKPKEPTACPQCGAVYHKGRWQWLALPDGAHEELCSACHRIHDGMPAGYVTLTGEFLREHKDELLHLVRNEGEREGEEHPMARIMGVQELETGIEVTTTDIHLARRIGEALHHAYQGKLEFHYNEKEYLLRVHWER